MIKTIDVPGDGNCMFWSSMLAYLEPVKKDKNKLKERCQKIFNSVEHWKDIFDYFNKTNNVYNIKHLVLLFRINVIEYMKKNINEEQKNILIGLLPEFNSKNEIALRLQNIKEAKTFEEYCEIMKKDGIYGDHYELFNISEFLNHNIIIFADNDRKKCIANINENFEEKITLNYVNNNHYQYFVEELEYDSGYDSKLESNNKESEEIKIDNFENFYSIIELKKRQIITEITKLENLNKDRESSKKTLQSLNTQIRLLEQESLKLITQKNNGIKSNNKITIINLAREKILKLLSDIKELERRLDLLNSRIQIQEEELELEIKDKKLVELISQKREIELEIQKLEKYQQQLVIKIVDNNNQMQTILNDNKSFKNQLIIKIDEINSNIKTLQDNIYIKNNSISRLKKEIESNEKNINSKIKDVQNIIQNIQIMQKWRDSIWRRIIVVLTFGIFCSYKNNQKKIDKANENRININKEINDLLITYEETIKQKKYLCTKILEHQKEITSLKENQRNLDMQLENDKNTKTEELKTKNKKIQSLLENIKNQITEQKIKLFNVSLALIESEKSLTELKKIKTEKESLDKVNKNWEEKVVANTLGFEKDKSKINSEASTSKNQSSNSKSQKM
ncbi:hypothetical protein [Spiroplasma ixodetis]|uniref:hypothetical protein n=1 Tax=Spiroplasma ixodetis TaxID=2141 RepID=UPI002576DF17|nr:hypothetical protein [Spiroplasma ixodetis]WJG71488.1 hypothetical protein SIXOD_v1c29440 [Spiroplasma ixodetis Y32]